MASSLRASRQLGYIVCYLLNIVFYQVCQIIEVTTDKFYFCGHPMSRLTFSQSVKFIDMFLYLWSGVRWEY